MRLSEGLGISEERATIIMLEVTRGAEDKINSDKKEFISDHLLSFIDKYPDERERIFAIYTLGIFIGRVIGGHVSG
jgi:hypothetical protein